MIKKICLLIIMLFVFVPFSDILAISEEELKKICDEHATTKKITEMLYEIKGMSFGENGIVLKGWAVRHDKDNYTLDNLLDTNNKKNTQVYIKINDKVVFGNQLKNCSSLTYGFQCATVDNNKKVVLNDKVTDLTKWGFSDEGTYYLRAYDMDDFFEAVSGVNYNYYGSYFVIFLDYDKLDTSGKVENNFKICVKHDSDNGNEYCEEMAVREDYCYKEGTDKCVEGKNTSYDIDFEITGLGDRIFINYSQARKTVLNQSRGTISYLRWCDSYELKENQSETIARPEGCGIGLNNGYKGYCPSYYQVYNKGITYDTSGNYLGSSGEKNCGSGRLSSGCLISTTKNDLNKNSNSYVRANFSKVIGNIGITLERDKYSINYETCNVKNTLKVTTSYSGETEARNDYRRVNENGANYANMRVFEKDGQVYCKNNSNKPFNYKTYNFIPDNQFGGSCMQTISVDLGKNVKAYANIIFEEVSKWEFATLPKTIKAGTGFEFSIGYTSHIKWDIINNIAAIGSEESGVVDNDVWILIDEGDGKYKDSQKTSYHSLAFQKIKEKIKSMYKNGDELNDALKTAKDNAIQQVTGEKDLAEVDGKWYCSESSVKDRTPSAKGERTIKCEYKVYTYINKETSGVTYEGKQNKRKTSESYLIYNYGDKTTNCIKNKNGFCLFSSLTYPCVSWAKGYDIGKDNSKNYSGLPVKYRSDIDDKYTVSQLNFKELGSLKNKNNNKEVIGNLGLRVYYDGATNVGMNEKDKDPGTGGGELCLMEILDYRPINLNNPFPKELNSAGYNWTNYLNAYWKEKGDIQDNIYKNVNAGTVFRNSNNLEYQISLNYDRIKSIKDRYTNNYLSFSGISTGDKATSKFINNDFASYFKKRNGGDIYKLGCGPASDEGSGC